MWDRSKTRTAARRRVQSSDEYITGTETDRERHRGAAAGLIRRSCGRRGSLHCTVYTVNIAQIYTIEAKDTLQVMNSLNSSALDLQVLTVNRDVLYVYRCQCATLASSSLLSLHYKSSLRTTESKALCGFQAGRRVRRP